MNPSINECVFAVDDDEDDLFLFQQVFQQYSPSCSLKSIASGEELLNTLAQRSTLPTLILLDLNMPLMGGFEALKHIKANRAYDSVQVVILTTSDNFFDQQKAVELGANGFLTKPPTLEEMNQLILHIRQEWLSGKCVFPYPYRD